MDYHLIISATFLWLGLFGLYSLRNMSIIENFKWRPIIGLSTFVQKIGASGVTVFIIVAIIKSTWYSPFINLIAGLIASAIIEGILAKLKLTRASTEKSEFGIMISAILTSISLYYMLTYYFD
jgi:hypothetical protein